MSAETTPLLDATRAFPPPTPSPEALNLSRTHPLHLRRALPSDAPTAARIAAAAYATSQFSAIACPHRFTHPADFTRDFHARIHRSLLAPHKLGYVCFPAGHPEHIVGYILLGRYGEDAGARAVAGVAAAASWGGCVRRWWWGVWWACVEWGWPSRVWDVGVREAVERAGERRDRRWEEAGMRERWHCGSCVVLPEWQRRGAGGKMMRVAQALAEAEGVGLVLESSAEGERLYRKAGFVRVGLFAGGQRKGGIMLWLPEERRGELKEWECVQDGGEGKRYENEVQEVLPEDRV